VNRFAHTRWPFFEPQHAALAVEADAWAARLDWAHEEDSSAPRGAEADATCRRLVRELGGAGYLRHCVPGGDRFDVRAIALLREVFAYHAGLADFAFVMQGLGSGPIALAGTQAQRAAHLPRVAAGAAIAAFALSEPDAGSDVAALATTARRDGDGWVLNGAKTWISNGGIADLYVVFAKSEQAPGTRAISAFVVEAGTPGLDASERIAITVASIRRCGRSSIT